MSNRSRQTPSRTVGQRASSGKGRQSIQSQQVGRRSGLAMAAAGIATALVLAYLVLLFAAPGVLPEFMRFGIGNVKPVGPSSEGRISFVRNNADGSNALFVVNPDGSNQQQLTADLIIDQAVWSPDGKYIAAQVRFGALSSIIRVEVGPDNKAVGDALRLTADEDKDSVLPQWSPDGTKITYQSKSGSDNFQVFVMNADGSDKKRVTDGKGLTKHPVWSPDGKMIAYVGSDGTSVSSELYVIDSSGGAARAVTSNGSVKVYPLWTNDGKSLVFAQGSGDRDQSIAVVSLEGGEPRTLVEAGSIKGLQMSPTEDKLVYYQVIYPTETTQGGTDVFVVPLEGGSPTLITPMGANDYWADWSPDGKKLTWVTSVSTETGPQNKILVANADGSDQRVITTGAGADYQPLWAPAVK